MNCFAWVCAVSLATAVSALAQIGGGSIIGVVEDPTTAAVIGAEVVAANLDTGRSDTATTNDQGYYEFPLLPAGRYVVRAKRTGFRPTESQPFQLNTGTRPRVDLALTLGAVSESVEVSAQAPMVNATTTDLGVVMDRGKIDSLPLNGRNFQDLVGLQAGVLSSPPGQGGRGGMEFNGSPGLGNNLLLDGVDMSFGENNAAASDTGAGGGGALINAVSVEALQEFKATGSAFSAEYGRATGGVLNLTTKGGTNALHGTLFEFFRNDKLDANSFFSNRSGLVKPPLRWNQFGGNLGGPIVRNKLFFFGNYEGAIVRRAQQIVGNVPTPALLSRLTPQLREGFSDVPTTFTPTSDPFIGLHRRNDRRTNDEHTFLGRGDYNLTNHRFTFRYSYNDQDVYNPALQLTKGTIFPMRFHNLVGQHGFTISPGSFNELRVGLNKVGLDRRNFRLDDPLLGGSGLEVSGVGLSANDQNHIGFFTDTYTIANNFTRISGKHTIKIGGEIRILRSTRDQQNNPTHGYRNIADLITDTPFQLTVRFSRKKAFDSTNYGFFVQDDWRVSGRVQLNLGLRYEYYTPLTGAYNIRTSDPYGPFGERTDPMWAPDRNNFAPRAGVVFDLLGNQKLVVRAGGGINYAPPQPYYYYDYSFEHPLLPYKTTLLPGDIPAGVSLAYPFPQSWVNSVIDNVNLLPAGFNAGRSAVDFNRRDEYSGQWNLAVQGAVARDFTLQAAYVGSRGVKLFSGRNLNEPDPALGRRPVPEAGPIIFSENAARSSYHALQISANRRFGGGLTFDAYYTWARVMGYYSSDALGTPVNGHLQDPLNIAGSSGPKISDLRHRFTSVVSYALPTAAFTGSSRVANLLFGGWAVQGIFNTQSGNTVNVLSGRDFVGVGRTTGQRPDATGIDPYVRDMETFRWLNPAAFEITAPMRERRYGNLGYNAIYGPGSINFDAALHKTFTVTEGHRLTFRFEMFNALNHMNPGNPNNTVSNVNFGTILNGSGGRNVQLGLKYAF